MPIITFAWSTPALLAGAKTVTRQPWSARTAAQFKPGALVQAYDRSPRTRGRCIATLRIVSELTYEPLSSIPDSDYEAEGWKWLHEHRGQLPGWVTSSDFSWEAFQAWRSRPGSVWVVRFTLEEILSSLPLPSDQHASAAQPLAVAS